MVGMDAYFPQIGTFFTNLGEVVGATPLEDGARRRSLLLAGRLQRSQMRYMSGLYDLTMVFPDQRAVFLIPPV